MRGRGMWNRPLGWAGEGPVCPRTGGPYRKCFLTSRSQVLAAHSMAEGSGCGIVGRDGSLPRAATMLWPGGSQAQDHEGDIDSQPDQNDGNGKMGPDLATKLKSTRARWFGSLANRARAHLFHVAGVEPSGRTATSPCLEVLALVRSATRRICSSSEPAIARPRPS